jgi:hypothetical protein
LMQHDDTVVTLFGQPNYCQRMGNKAAYMTIDKTGKTDIVQFADTDVFEFICKFILTKQEQETPKNTQNTCLPHYFS